MQIPTSSLTPSQRLDAIQAYLEFYLSPANLRRDSHITKRMNPSTTALNITEFLVFSQMIRLNTTPIDIARAAMQSPNLLLLSDPRDVGSVVDVDENGDDDERVKEFYVAPVGGDKDGYLEIGEESASDRCVVAIGVHPWIPTFALINLFGRFGKLDLVWRPKFMTVNGAFRKNFSVVEFERVEDAIECVEKFKELVGEDEQMEIKSVVRFEDFEKEGKKMSESRKRMIRLSPLKKGVDVKRVNEFIRESRVRTVFRIVEEVERRATILVKTAGDAELFESFVETCKSMLFENEGEGEQERQQNDEADDEHMRLAEDVLCETSVASVMTNQSYQRFLKSIVTVPGSSLVAMNSSEASEQESQNGSESDDQSYVRTPGTRYFMSGMVVAIENVSLLESEARRPSVLLPKLKEVMNGVSYYRYDEESKVLKVKMNSKVGAEYTVQTLNGNTTLFPSNDPDVPEHPLKVSLLKGSEEFAFYQQVAAQAIHARR